MARSAILILCFALVPALLGCQTTRAPIGVRIVVPPIDVQAPHRHDIEIALWIPPAQRDYTFKDTSTTYVGSYAVLAVPLGRSMEDMARDLFVRAFPSIRVIRNRDEASGNTILLQPSVKHFEWSAGLSGDTANLTLEMAAMQGTETLLRREYSAEHTSPLTGFMHMAGQSIGHSVGQTLLETLTAAFTDITSDSALASRFAELEQGRMSVVTQGYEAVNEIHQVADLEAEVRKLPLRGAAIVRRIPQGGTVQVIGRLPTGWLKVAEEGVAVGWVYYVALAATPPAPPATVQQATRPALPWPQTKSRFPTIPEAITYPTGRNSPDDIAVIIGNADYSSRARDIPDVIPAYADAAGFRRYVIEALGIPDDNIIELRDATATQIARVFGNERTPQGQLFDWVKPNRSRVWVYYSGHGAPGSADGTAFLVPSDADAGRVDLDGYALETLYANLGKLPAQSVTVVLEACFSGASQSGPVVPQASPVFLKPKIAAVPQNVTVIAAGGGTQIASWEKDNSHGLFTRYFLKGMAGAADANHDGTVELSELEDYLADTVTYWARRYYGRSQRARILQAQPQ